MTIEIVPSAGSSIVQRQAEPIKQQKGDARSKLNGVRKAPSVENPWVGNEGFDNGLNIISSTFDPCVPLRIPQQEWDSLFDSTLASLSNMPLDW
eukprot:CAMPEP_0113662118 /NCGR_PEP_ID=MMETSP0038_2-20120614/384_1 /TAXON_ID=2898 /ORGANISM="Cryptomonas paramecium" /LENGTH=93 /DNA_ID=CAMNT_0000576949 /DNA_START=87 /DNA_END=365 /DNA_ORIENTATION=- /assembly_acc=CAM_ASM_000170